jgi:aspartate/methionine/tyrosine aminotransferase
MANHLALAATLDPGDEVLIEHPTYEVIVDLLRYLGATVRTFERQMENGFRVDPKEIERQMTPRTRVIVLTNLHNPTGALMDETSLRAVGDIAKHHHALVLVDEVYLEAMYEQRPRSAYHLGEQFLVTSSLTKAYGLSGLRCGWVLATRELAQRMWHINDLYGVNAAHPAERLSAIALDHLDRVAARAKKIL